MTIRRPRWLRRLVALFTWDARDSDMDRETGFHLEALAREYERAGIAPDEAALAARRRFGDVTRIKERGHDVRRAASVEDLVRDVRHTARGLARSPGFAVSVILTLALGIGANTAIFSVIDQLLLRPLPYPDGERLLSIRETMGSLSIDENAVSPANWLDWQRESRTLQSLAAWRTATFTLTGVGEPLRVDAQRVSAEFFPTLGVEPLVGRAVTPEDDRPDAPQVAVLSYDLWQQRFGGDPKVLGRDVQFNDRPFRIVGVMPAGFQFVHPGTGVWTAFRFDRAQRWRETDGRFVNVLARLRPEATLAQATSELQRVARHLAATYEYNKGWSVRLQSLREDLTGQVATSLAVLYVAVGVLLSIACFNAANLLLARAASRRREIAIRTSLGAGRMAIVRQQLVESLLLAALGGALGVLIANLSLDALTALAPPDLLRVPELHLNRRVLWYALGVSVFTGIAVGLAPALLAARRSVITALRSSGRGVAHAPRVRQALVVCQVAMTVVLLCGAGLLAKTIVALERVDNGFDRHDVLTMSVALPGARYEPDHRVVFFSEAVAALRALPGATSAAAAESLPAIGMPRAGSVIHLLGTPELPVHQRPYVTIRVVTAGYFRTLGIPVLRGREFAEDDDANTGFVVNQAFVRAHLAGGEPFGTAMSVRMEEKNPHLPIIGVVGDVSEGSVGARPEPTVFYLHDRLKDAAMTLFVRASHADALAQPAVAALRRIDPNLAVTEVRSFASLLSESVARERLNALVVGAFALSALLLSSLGLYALLAFLVTERTRELGIRIALGARLSRLSASVVGGGLRLVATGAAIGVIVSLPLLRSFGTLLFGVSPHDPTTYAGGLTLLLVVAALASYLPARRAARVEPLVALRQE